MSIDIVQITDLHLFAERDAQLAGVATWETFEAVLALIDAAHADYDYLVITGDIAQDEAAATYQCLREALGARLPRCRLIPGNHDDRAHLRAAFPEQFQSGQASLDFRIRTGGWQLLGLDTQLTGEVYGCLDAGQLAWLETQLHDAALSTAIFLHHPPFPIRVDWLDKPDFVNAERFAALVESAPQVRVVCAGHVHQTFEGRMGGATVYTTPSTCVQFASRGDGRYDTAAAGYRHLHLDGNGVETEVHRLG